MRRLRVAVRARELHVSGCNDDRVIPCGATRLLIGWLLTPELQFRRDHAYFRRCAELVIDLDSVAAGHRSRL